MRFTAAIVLALALGCDSAGEPEPSNSTGDASTSTGKEDGSSGSSSSGEPYEIKECPIGKASGCDDDEECIAVPDSFPQGFCALKCGFYAECATGTRCREHGCLTPCTKANDCEAMGMECVEYPGNNSFGERYCAPPATPSA